MLERSTNQIKRYSFCLFWKTVISFLLPLVSEVAFRWLGFLYTFFYKQLHFLSQLLRVVLIFSQASCLGIVEKFWPKSQPQPLATWLLIQRKSCSRFGFDCWIVRFEFWLSNIPPSFWILIAVKASVFCSFFKCSIKSLIVSVRPLLVIWKFHFQRKASLSELVNFHSPWNHQKTLGLLMISGNTEVD